MLDDIISSLETTVESCVSFNSSSVSFDYKGTIYYDETDPFCRLSLIRDTEIGIGPYETRHLFMFQARVTHQGTGVTDDLLDFVGYVGEIKDKIESDRKLGGSYITDTAVTNTEYSQNTQQNYVIYHAYMDLEVEAVRNTA